jgi:predicted methyltransferase
MFVSATLKRFHRLVNHGEMNFDRSINELSRNFDPIGSRRALDVQVLGNDMMTKKTVSILSFALLALVACATPTPVTLQPTPDAILGAPMRAAEDRARDERRKAVESLAFMSVRPGIAILDIEAGSGYWSEILARATGPSGSVIMQNPPAFEGRLKPLIDARLGSNGLANMRPSFSNFDALAPTTGSVDLVTWVQGPHELYFTPPSGSLGNPSKTFQEIARVLKRGGVFIVIDHSALPGQPATTGQTLHRIDPALTIASAAAVGLVLERRGDFLANPADPKTKSAFDASIRGSTDQHALRFVKR